MIPPQKTLAQQRLHFLFHPRPLTDIRTHGYTILLTTNNDTSMKQLHLQYSGHLSTVLQRPQKKVNLLWGNCQENKRTNTIGHTGIVPLAYPPTSLIIQPYHNM